MLSKEAKIGDMGDSFSRNKKTRTGVRFSKEYDTVNTELGKSHHLKRPEIVFLNLLLFKAAAAFSVGENLEKT